MEFMDTVPPITVLLLDDERLLLDLYMSAFTDAGFDAVSFTDPRAAIEALKTARKDVILFDIHMPEMNGLEFLETIKRDGLSGTRLTVALTNEAKEEDTKRIKDLGADGHFVKSQLSPKDIVAAVNELLAAKK